MSIISDMIISGNRVIARSYAKINLTLDVLSKRSDGYHDVEMIMQTISLFDLIVADKTADQIRISTNLRYLPCNERNIAYKAAALFFTETGIKGGVKLLIHKNIPVAAGLAGGSGNAAATLCALNALYNAGLSEEELCRMGAKLGADVPFCISGGTMLASGIGDVLLPLPPMPHAYVLIVKPQINISTAAIYEKIDNAPINHRPDTVSMIRALNEGDLYGIADGLCNVMESVTETMHPIIAGIKKKMIKNGAMGALMSGSGSAVFGLFDSFDKAKASADSFFYQFADVYLCRTI